MAEGGRPRVVVVGGGITGLACAWFLRDRADVTVLEAAGEPGGKIRTEPMAGVPVESGPDVLLARVPWAVDLAREVGLGDQLVAPATGRAFAWSRGRLVPLPEGLVLGVPSRLGPVVRSGLVSPPGLARAALDLVLPRRRGGPDPTVAEVVGHRLGTEVLERVVEPLLGGIQAGRADGLSLQAVAPEVAAAARAHRSLVMGLRRRPVGAGGGPVFLSVEGGLGRLVAALADAVDLRCHTEVTAVRPGSGAAAVVEIGPGAALDADRVVLTTPAFAAAAVVGGASPRAAALLAAVRYAPVVTVTLAYPPGAVRHPLDGSGFLVPRVDGRLLTAATFMTSKWPALARDGVTLLRASAGRAGDDRALALDDGALSAAVHEELDEALGIDRPPLEARVRRWWRAIPQYEPGHLDRLARIREALATDLPGVELAGAAYGGLGIAACVRQARAAADAVASPAGQAPGPTSPR